MRLKASGRRELKRKEAKVRSKPTRTHSRKRTGEALQEYIRRLFADLPLQNPNPILRLGKNGTFLLANKAGEILLHDWKCKVGGKASKYWCDLVVEVLRSRSSKNVDIEHDEKTYMFSIVPFHDAGYANLYGRDITKRKRIETALRESEKKYRQLVEKAQEGIWAIDTQANTTYVNSKMTEILGYTVKEMLGKSLFSFMNENDTETTKHHLELRRQGTEEKRESQLLRKDGTPITVNFSSSPIADDKGNYIGALALVTDITERKRIEQSFRESEEKYHAIVENSPNLIAIIQDGVLKFVNHALCESSGYSFEELTSPSLKYLETTISPRFQELTKKNLEKRLRGETVSPYVVDLKTRDGSEFPVLVRGARISYQGKTADLVILTDMTERKRLEERITQDFLTLNGIVNSVDMPIFAVDRQYRYTSFNKAHANIMEVLHGKHIEIGQSHLEYVTVPEDRQTTKRSLDRALAGERTVEEEYRGEQDRSRLCFEISRNPITGRDGAIIGVAVFGKDITEHKRMEKEVEILARYPAENPSPILRLDKNGVILHGNTASDHLLKDWGKKIGDYAPKYWSDLVAEVFESKSSKNVEIESGNNTYLFNIVPVVDSGYVNFYGEDITGRKWAEEALKKSETFLNEVGEMAKVGGWELDVETKMVCWTKETYQIHEVSETEKFDVTKVVLFFDTPGRSTLEAALQRGMEKGEPFDLEFPFTTAKGKHLWTRAIGKAVQVNGKVVKLMGAFQDTTQRKRMEYELKSSERRFRDVSENALEWIWEVDGEGKYLYASPAVKKILGYETEEILGKHFYDLFHSEDREKLKKTTFEAFAKKQPFHDFLNRNVRNDGETVWLLTSGVPMLDEKGNLLGYRGVDTDITERKQMEDEIRRNSEHFEQLVEQRTRELHNSESRYRAVVQDQTELICRLKPDWTLNFVNDAYCRYFGKTREELIGSSFAPFILEEDREKVRTAQATISPENPVVLYEERVVIPDGRISWQEWSSRGIFDMKGNLVEIQGVGRDITERRRLEEQLKNAQRLATIGETSAMVGHDLRNPLQVMMNRLYLAKDVVKKFTGKYSEVANELGLTEMFAELEDQMRYMNKIVSDLQDYARIIKSKSVETDLNGLLDKTFSLIKIPSNVKVVRKIYRDTAKINVDPDLLQRVLHNLIINGVQAMPQGGTLTIKASKNTDMIQISIQDTGVGIPPEQLDKLWSALQTTKAKGVGLGLPVCKRLVEAQNGKILVESQVGKGATFTIKLPLRREVN